MIKAQNSCKFFILFFYHSKKGWFECEANICMIDYVRFLYLKFFLYQKTLLPNTLFYFTLVYYYYLIFIIILRGPIQLNGIVKLG